MTPNLKALKTILSFDTNGEGGVVAQPYIDKTGWMDMRGSCVESDTRSPIHSTIRDLVKVALGSQVL